MDTERLRAGTRLQHEAVEALLPLMDADLTREQYSHVLRCMYRVVRPWEDWAALHAPPSFTMMAAERRRAHMIEADLEFLDGDISLRREAEGPSGIDDIEAIFARAETSPASFEAAFLGAMYVVEGSTLGGQYIARHAEALFGFEPGVGDAYFRGYGEQTGPRWRNFKQLLLDLPDEHTETVIAAAKAMFSHFGKALGPCAKAASGSPSRA